MFAGVTVAVDEVVVAVIDLVLTAVRDTVAVAVEEVELEKDLVCACFCCC